MRGGFAVSLHPVAKVLTVLLISLALAFHLKATLGPVLLLTAVMLIFGLRGWRALARSVRRMRWLLLSILILHAYFTPGNLMWPLLGGFSPSVTGLETGLERAAMLLIMVAWAVWLMQAIPPLEMAAALAWLLSPLRLVGLPVERFSRRLSLTLQAVEEVGERARRLRAELQAVTPPQNWADGLRIRADVLQRLFRELAAEEHADVQAQPAAVTLAGWRWYDSALLVTVMLSLGMSWVTW